MATVRPFQVNNGLEVSLNANVGTTLSASDYLVNLTGPTTSPSTVFNFTTPYLDPRITFVRASNASYRAANGTIVYASANTPRINYNSNGQCLGLLIENQITNDFTLSSQIGNTSTGLWYVAGGDGTESQAVTLNAIAAPDGSNTATFFYHAKPTVTYKTLGTNFGAFSNRPYTHSVFVKAGGEPYVSFLHFDGQDGINVLNFYYYFSNNSFSSVSAGSSNCAIISGPTSEPYANGWYRISYTYHYTSGSSRYVTHKMDLDYGSAVVGRGFYVWGAQHETNDKPSSYVPTLTSAATRTADFAFVVDNVGANNLTSWFNYQQGTFSVEWNVPYVGTTTGLYSGYPGPISIWRPDDATNVIGHIFFGDAGTTANKGIGYESFSNNVNVVYLSPSGFNVSNNTFFKTSFGYAANGHVLSCNGNTATAAVTTTITPLATKIDIGRSRAGWLYGHVRSIKYWPTRLSNTDITYTSI